MAARILRFPIERTSGFGPLAPLFGALTADDPWIVVGAMYALRAAEQEIDDRDDLAGSELVAKRWMDDMDEWERLGWLASLHPPRHTCRYDGPPEACYACDREEKLREAQEKCRQIESEYRKAARAA